MPNCHSLECDELEARVQRRQSGETRSYSREEVSAELEAILT
jgi:hypothetical protein